MPSLRIKEQHGPRDFEGYLKIPRKLEKLDI